MYQKSGRVMKEDKLRETYRRIHGKAAIRGRVPEHAHRRIHNKLQAIEATAFFRIYKELAGDSIFKYLTSDRVIDAYQTYKRKITNSPIDAVTAWYLARDIREGVVEIKHCQKCGSEYLYDQRSDCFVRCLGCQF